MIFITLVPLFLAIEGLSPSKAFKYGFIWGFIFYLGYIYYIAWVTIPGMLAAVLIMSLIPATAFWVYVRLLQKSPGMALVFLPSYFIVWNWLFTMSDFNYPWMDIGYALGYYVPFIQAAEIGGVYLISLVILVVNTCLYASISEKFHLGPRNRTTLRFVFVVLISALFLYGYWRLSNIPPQHEKDGLSIGLIQGNMTRDVKWKPEYLQENFERYFDMSRKAANAGADLIIWPETATPTYLVQYSTHFNRFKNFADSLGVPILTGTPFYESVGPGEYVYFNSAILAEPGKEGYEIYKKIHLVPMSEKIPLSGRFKVLKEIRLGQADWSSGSERTIFDLDGYKFATVICIESVYPGYCREFAQRDAEFLVVITNDMWFGRTSLLEQHAMMSVFRAVENRIPVVRAANTGISMSIDKWGRIVEKSDIFTVEYLISRIYPEESNSVYGSIGDIIPRVLLAFVFISLVIAFVKRKRYNSKSW
ncbi:MAG: apolipoprotein N-acyltransferase [Candidatus Zixiibacteriota bacterium]|nr:MAG: apolipoprotein N-acyltransferase [candidate division Zixibacteria bacterium]